MLKPKEMTFSFIIALIAFVCFIFAVFFGGDTLHSDSSYAVSSSGKVYYIDDYTIVDGSIIFSIDGVEYHFSNYSIREIEK